MIYAMIKLNSPTLDGNTLPLFMYTMPLRVLEDNYDCIGVILNKTSYWFDKKYIDRYI
jgi:hypothetical protein